MSTNGKNYPIGLQKKDGRNARFRALLKGDDIIVAPGAFDCISARLVENAGFPAVYLTGAGMSMSMMGAPDLGMVTFGEILERVRRIADAVTTPVICDADTGYGGPLNVMRTVRDLEQAGVSAIQIEDQVWPKRCGHMPDRMVAPVKEMVGRIQAAVDVRNDDDLCIIARTDARSTLGIDEAIDRANAYFEAGADILFVESPESVEEMKRLNREVKGPTLANMVEGGRTPTYPTPELQKMGYKLAIFPGSLGRTLGKTGSRVLAALKQEGTTDGMGEFMYTQPDLFHMFDYERWTATEARFGDRK